MTHSLNIRKRVSIVLVFIMMFASYPYVFDRIIALPSKNIVYSVCIAILVLLAFSKKQSVEKLPPRIVISIVIQAVTWLFFFFYHKDSAYFTRILFLMITIMTIWSLNRSGALDLFVNSNNKWICVQSVMGVFVFVLFFVGLISPILTFKNVDTRNAYFFGLTCSNAVYGNFMRVAGFFDEPGALAFWGIYALVLNKLFFDNKKIEILLIFGLLSTFSLAYFIQIFLYVVLFYLHHLKRIIIPLMLLGGLVFYVYKQGPDNPLYQATFQRLERNEEGQINTSRYRLTELAKKQFAQNPVFGVGASNMDELEYMGDNPYETLATDGIVGTIAIYLPLLLLLIHSKSNKKIFSAIIILSAGFLQRPFHVNMMHYLMFYLFISLSYKYINKQQLNE